MFDMLVARSQSAVAAAELFVSLPEHAFARAAVSRLTSSGRRTAPLSAGLTFLSGPEGSGKSLLARQAVREASRRQSKLRHIIAGADELADLLSLADEQQCLAELSDLFRSLDLLVCEDLHALEGKAANQDLLLGLIDGPCAETTRVLITSRRLPGELREFSSRWISRCHGGLCATLPLPGVEGRRELILRLMQAKHLPLTEPVVPTVEWLAGRLPVSPRDLSRAIDELAESCERSPAVIDIVFLERWLSRDVRTATLSLDAIATVVAGEFGLEPDELRSRSRHQGLIVPRQCAMFLAKELTGRPLELIGRYFGERTHTTVSHSLSRLKELLPHAPTLRQQVQKLRKRLAELRQEDCA